MAILYQNFGMVSLVSGNFRTPILALDNTKIEIIWYYATHNTIYFKVVGGERKWVNPQLVDYKFLRTLPGKKIKSDRFYKRINGNILEMGDESC